LGKLAYKNDLRPGGRTFANILGRTPAGRSGFRPYVHTPAGIRRGLRAEPAHGRYPLLSFTQLLIPAPSSVTRLSDIVLSVHAQEWKMIWGAKLVIS